MCPNHTTPAEIRFWRYVDKRDPDECWEWTGSTYSNGYGMLSLKPQRRTLLAHRLSYEIHCGPISAGLCCLHTCDNRRCVNPAHLRLGTKAENTRDMLRKGRGKFQVRRGIAHHKTKLTEEAVRLIRMLFDLGTPQTAIAEQFGISHTTVGAIGRRETWTDVP